MNRYLKNWGLKFSHCDTKMTSICQKSKKKKKRCTYCVYERLTRWNYRCVWYRNCSKVLNKEQCALQTTKNGSLRGSDPSKPAGVSTCTNLQLSEWHHNDSWLRHINHQKCQNRSKYNYLQLWMTKKTPQRPWYDNDRFGPYIPNSHFLTVTVTPKNRPTKNAENIRINSIKAAAHLEWWKSDLMKVVYE